MTEVVDIYLRAYERIDSEDRKINFLLNLKMEKFKGNKSAIDALDILLEQWKNETPYK